MDEKRFRVLRFVAKFIEAIGWLIVVAGPVLAFFTVAERTGQVAFKWLLVGTPIVMAFALVLSAVIGFPLIAYGQLIEVLVETEANTRATAEAIGQLRRSLGPGMPGGPRGAPDIFDVP